MKNSKWIGIIAGLVIIGSGFLPWGNVPVPGVGILNGFSSAIYPKFGKPVLLNLYLLPVMFVLFLLPRLWAIKINPLIGAIGMAWAIRNYLLFLTCKGGNCPVIYYGLYIYVAACFVLLLMTLLTPIPVQRK